MNVKEYYNKYKGDEIKEPISFTDLPEDKKLLHELVEYFTQRQKEGANVLEESPFNLLKEKAQQELFEYQMDEHVLVVDCETDGLYGDFLSVGIVVIDAEKKIKDVLYVYIEGASASQDWVNKNVLPKLDATSEDIKTILAVEFEPKVHSVSSQEELFSTTAELLQEYQGSKVYAEHLFPVEWRFFHDERLTQLEMQLVEVAPEAESYFEKKEEIHQHKAWFDAYKTYQALNWRKPPYSSHVFVLPFTILPQKDTSIKSLKVLEKNWQIINPKNSKEFPYFNQRYYKIAENDSQAYLTYASERFFNDEFLEVVKKKYQTYQYKNPQGKEYYQIIIGKEVNKEEACDVYNLALDYVLLRFLDEDQKLGFLIIVCHNMDYPLASQIATINQYGRRIYDPFLTNYSPYSESPLDIRLVTADEREIEPKNFLNQKPSAHQKRPRQAILDLVESIFGEDKLSIFNKDSGEKRPLFDSIIDDRMFVISNYFLSPYNYDLLADGMRGKDYQEFFKQLPENDLKAIYEQEKQLYAYTYIDKDSSTYQSPVTIGKVLDESIYDRWLDYGTIYGLTQHSMIMFNRGTWAPEFLFAYFYSEYLELVLFVLAQRMKILDYSFRAGKIAEEIKDPMKAQKGSETSLDLQKDYVVFKNQYLLAEISPQEQAVDLYRMMQKNLYVSEQKELLDDQIQSLYEIRVLMDSREKEKRDNALNIILFAFAIVSVLIGFNDFTGIFTESNNVTFNLELLKNFLPIAADNNSLPYLYGMFIIIAIFCALLIAVIIPKVYFESKKYFNKFFRSNT